MDKIIQKYIKPLGILVVGSFVISLITNYVSSPFNQELYTILLVIMLFLFGMSLNHGKFSFKYFSLGQIIILVIAVFLYLYQTNRFNLAIFKWFETYTIAHNVLVYVIYVYLGWLFKENK